MPAPNPGNWVATSPLMFTVPAFKPNSIWLRGFAGKLYVPLRNSVCCGILRDGTTEESAALYPDWVVVDVCEKPYEANRHKTPVRKEYLLLAIIFS